MLVQNKVSFSGADVSGPKKQQRLALAKPDVLQFSGPQAAKAKSLPLALRFAGKDARQIDQALANSGLGDLSPLVKQIIPSTAVLTLTKKPVHVSSRELDTLRREIPELRHLPDAELVEKVLTPTVGGSGFWIKAPNGKRYLVTNNHVASALDNKKQVPLIPEMQHPMMNMIGLPTRGPMIQLESKVNITGDLNIVRDYDAILSKKKPAQMSFKVAELPNGTPALSKVKDLAVLEPIDPDTGNYAEPPEEAGYLSFVEEKDWNEAMHPGKPVMKVGRKGGNIAAGIINALSSMGPCKNPMGCHCFVTDNLYIVSSLDLSHGDSGGPLVSMQGKVLGVNTMTDGGHDAHNDGHGYSLAVPEAVKVLKDWGFMA